MSLPSSPLSPLSPTPGSPRAASVRSSGPRTRRGRRRGPLVALLVVVAGLGVGACGGTVGDVVNNALTAPACQAIDGVQQDLTSATAEGAGTEELQQLVAAAQLATTAVSALGDQVPAEASSGLDAAQQQLDAAASGVQGTVEQQRAALQAALDGYAAQLDTVTAALGC